ncbi:MAG: Shedu anti-phage system protein SduA domain-containing protein [Candidatus Paceibacterota bacterium]
MSRINPFKPSEEEIIRTSIPNRLYSHEFEAGRFFQVVHEDEDGATIRFAPRTMLKVIYIKDQEDIEGFEIIKLVNEAEKERVKLSKFNFAQLKEFLRFISEIDLKGITARRLKILDDQELDADSIRSVKTLLSKEGGADLVETLINEGIISSKDIVNTSFRKRGLQIFKKLKDNPDYWKTYADENDIKKHSEEKVWQYFFEKNQWIFGYGLDYRYQEILQREVHLSDAELDGSNTVIGDYLLGDNFFTTFIELKKPTTPLFGSKGNRSNSWKLSNDLIESVSQILEHKASGLIRLDKQQYINGEPVEQKAYDSKVLLIIGNWKELDKAESTLEQEIKKKTFELFRRDSRNVDILTFDELYERAHFIAEGEKIAKEDSKIIYEEDDDLPF